MNQAPARLESIQVASPCHVSWDSMSGDERARFCDQCGKHVYNLSNMTRRDAEDLIERTEGRLCVRLFKRSDGTVLTQDCPVGLAALRRPFYLIGALAAAFLIAVLGVLTVGAFTLPRLLGHGGGAPGPIQQVMDFFFPPVHCVQGGLAPVPPPPPAPAPVNPPANW